MSDYEDYSASASDASSIRPAKSRKKGRPATSASDDSESETDEEPVVRTRQKRKPQPQKPVNEDSDSASDSGSDETDASTEEENPFICFNCSHEHGLQTYISPLPKHLLETNDPPLESEEVSLQQIIDNADFDQEIADVDDTISRAEYLLRCLKRRRLEIQASALAAKGVTSAIRRVPREVIMAIVLYALGDSIEATTLDVSKGLWVYSQVCRLWREEILSCRAIWGGLDINVPKEEKGCGQWPAALKTALARANPRKCKNPRLRIQLRLASDSRLTREILQSLVESSLHWVEATLILPRTSLPRLKNLKDRVPLLESLRIQHLSTRPLDTKSIRKLFKVAPALRLVNLANFREISLFELPWAKLTHFNDGENAHFDINRLTEMTSIVALTIPATWRAGPNSAAIGYSFTSDTRIPSLKSLDLSFFGRNYNPYGNPLVQTGSSVLSTLVLPALEELITSDFLEPVIAMINKSSCRIKHLRFLQRGHTPTNLALLERFFAVLSPSLETLDLTAMQSAGVTVFLEHINDLAAFPDLKKVTLCCSDLVHQPAFNAIQHLIRVRKDPGTTVSISEVHFRETGRYLGRDGPANVKSWFARLEHFNGVGMKIWSEI
ncbi:hypothetical protein C8J56DRAFT_384658 [Mycena floridula]|nr:hypothetical protein C8J56DRAFT_384658 [Mycena floridula]